MENQFKTYGYHITTDPTFQNEKFGITPELEKQFEQLFFEAQNKNNKKIINKLTELIIRYPRVPHLKNYLSVAYNVRGKHEKAVEVNNWILSEHPDYLFALINKANLCIENGKPDQVPEILGEAMEIKALYPDRDLFHLAEITAYLTIVIRYYSAIENLELAENKLEILKKIAPDHDDTEQAEKFLFTLRLKTAAARFEEENKQRITPVTNNPVIISKNTTAPKFENPEIHMLYNYGLDIPEEILKEIIALPRKSLIKDLEKIFDDAVNRYDYFIKLGWKEDTHTFVLHAIFILKEINATVSIPKIFSFFKYDNEFLEFWIGDHITETIWQCFYSLGINNPGTLKEYLMQPGIYTYCKTSISEALCQMILHCPEKREEILAVYSDVFNFFSKASIEDNVIDSDFLGFAIGDTIDCNLNELLPIIKVLFDKKYVSLGINGNYIDVEKEFHNFKTRDHKKVLYNIFELYEDVLYSWAGYNEEQNNTLNTVPQQAVSVKIGRNDPCPCGSGKKYKKCCLNKMPKI